MKTIVTIVGARPQFIKLPLVSGALRKFAREVLVHTGQHYDANMSEVFFDELGIPKPDYNLGVGSMPREEQIDKMQKEIELVLKKEKADLVLIYGDTNSTLAGAQAAKKLNIPIAHVEAGMRSYNQEMPEEINRVESDKISNLLFCPTKSAVENLSKEGITQGVYWTGDVMYDIQLKEVEKSQQTILKDLEIEPKSYFLVTVHRQGNTDNRENLTQIIEAFNNIQDKIIFPLHPRTKKYLEEYNLKLEKNIQVIEPLGYQEMVALEVGAKMILTDSGGVQKEAYLAKIPCVTLRDETEWTETVESGWNKLAGADKDKILNAIKEFEIPSKHPDFLGNGQAFQKIADLIEQYLKNSS